MSKAGPKLTTTQIQELVLDENSELIARLEEKSLELEQKDSGKKFDEGKVDLTLIPIEAQLEIARVLEYGAKKYGRNNYRKGFKWLRVSAAALRHLYAWISGEDKDPETGLSHLAHACCSLMFLLVFEKTGIGEDNRRE